MVAPARLQLEQAWTARNRDRPAIAVPGNVLDAGHCPLRKECAQSFPVKRTGEPKLQGQAAVGRGRPGLGSPGPELDRRCAKRSRAIPVELPHAAETGHIGYFGYR